MPKRAYVAWNPSKGSVQIVARAIAICEAYARQGYNLTLRQLYYQFVSRDWLPNNMQSYKRLGSIVNDARLAGYIDWDHLEDRTRNLEKLARWYGPEDAQDAIAQQFRMRLWDNQPEYCEVWVEKEALADVVSRPADRWYVPYFPCRGYVSQSEMWAAAQRLIEQGAADRKCTIIHLGDHDPSGIDMTRDIRDRLYTFGADVNVERIALNYDQLATYNPPPNPAKMTDSRANDYVDQFGYESWELDAINPPELDRLIEDEILLHLDQDQWQADWAEQERERAVLSAISGNWRDVAAYARERGWVQEPEES